MSIVEMTIHLTVDEILQALWRLPEHERDYVQHELASGQPKAVDVALAPHVQTINIIPDRDATFGLWADQTDIDDSVAFSAMLRRKLSQRSDVAPH